MSQEKQKGQEQEAGFSDSPPSRKDEASGVWEHQRYAADEDRSGSTLNRNPQCGAHGLTKGERATVEIDGQGTVELDFQGMSPARPGRHQGSSEHCPEYQERERSRKLTPEGADASYAEEMMREMVEWSDDVELVICWKA